MLKEEDIIESNYIAVEDVGVEAYQVLCNQPNTRQKYVITKNILNDMLIGETPGLFYSKETNSYELSWACIKDLDLSNVKHPETNEPVRFSFEGCTMVNCQIGDESFAENCLMIGGRTGQSCAFKTSKLHNGKGMKLGMHGIYSGSSLHHVDAIGAGSIIAAKGTIGIDQCHLESGCMVFGGKVNHCTYDDGVQILHNNPETINDSVVRKLQSTKHLRGITDVFHARGSEHRVITGNKDFLNTRIIYPDVLNDVSLVVNQESKHGHIDDFVMVKIDGVLDYQLHQNRYVLDKLEHEVELIDLAKLKTSLDENYDAMKNIVSAFVKDAFPSASINHDMFVSDGAVESNKVDFDALADDLTGRIVDGVSDTRENCRSHKDLSNDHKFATELVGVIKAHVGEVSFDQRVKRYAVGPEDMKRLITNVVAQVPALHEFEVIKSSKIEEVEKAMASIEHDMPQMSQKDIAARLRADALENKQHSHMLEKQANELPAELQADLFSGMEH